MNRQPIFASVLAALLALVSGIALAQQMLGPQDAFKSQLRQPKADTVELRFEVAPGYVLYPEKFRFELNGKPVAHVELPARHAASMVVELRLNTRAKTGDVLAATSQGCSTLHQVCFPPMKNEFKLKAL